MRMQCECVRKCISYSSASFPCFSKLELQLEFAVCCKLFNIFFFSLHLPTLHPSCHPALPFPTFYLFSFSKLRSLTAHKAAATFCYILLLSTMIFLGVLLHRISTLYIYMWDRKTKPKIQEKYNKKRLFFYEVKL